MKIWARKAEAAPTAAEIPFPGVVEAMDGSDATAGAWMPFTSPGFTQNSTLSLAVLSRFS